MNTTQIRERNYKLVESVRQQNMREQRRLSDTLYSRQGMNAAHKYELASMSYEQRKLKEELAKIQKSTSTTQGVLPPRRHSLAVSTTKHERSSRELPERKGVTVKKHEENVILIDDRKPRMFNKQGVPLQGAQSESKTEAPEAMKARQVSQNRITTESKKGETTFQRFNSSFAVNPETSNLTAENQGAERSVSPGNKPMNEIDVKNARANVKQRLGPSNTENTVKQSKTDPSKTDPSKTDPSKTDPNNKVHLSVSSPVPTKQPRALSPIYESGADANNTNKKKQSLKSIIQTKIKVNEAVHKLKSLKKKNEEENEDNPARLNPDGSLRTMYQKQDFGKSVAEAKRARYLRHKEKQWFEKELSVQEIFDQEVGEEGQDILT